MCCFFFNDTATTEIYTLSLHDALPICPVRGPPSVNSAVGLERRPSDAPQPVYRHLLRQLLFLSLSVADRKSTRLNSSHANISHAVFCLKKKHHTCSSAVSRFISTLKLF